MSLSSGTPVRVHSEGPFWSPKRLIHDNTRHFRRRASTVRTCLCHSTARKHRSQLEVLLLVPTGRSRGSRRFSAQPRACSRSACAASVDCSATHLLQCHDRRSATTAVPHNCCSATTAAVRRLQCHTTAAVPRPPQCYDCSATQLLQCHDRRSATTAAVPHGHRTHMLKRPPHARPPHGHARPRTATARTATHGHAQPPHGHRTATHGHARPRTATARTATARTCSKYSLTPEMEWTMALWVIMTPLGGPAGVHRRTMWAWAWLCARARARAV